jgi:hypothetical protein
MILDNNRLLELAELVLCNLHDWREELRLVEPSRGGSYITLTTASSGGIGSPVETFVVRRDDLDSTLRAVERRLRKLSPDLRAVYEKVYGRGVYDEKGQRAKQLSVAEDLGRHPRTVGRHVRRIKMMVAGTLANLGPQRLRGLLRE